MNEKANDTFAFDLENRLDDFFSDSLPAPEAAPANEQEPERADIPLKDLKSSILSMDWEITDDGLGSFLEQIEGLKEHFIDNKICQKYLKILHSLGKYLRSRKSKAHPETTKRIMAVYSALEETVTSDELSQDDKEKMLREEIVQFQQLKSQIVNPKSSSSPKVPQGVKQATSMDEVIKAIDALKATITSELTAIRQELKQLSK